MTEKGCDNCYYTYFDERAYPCSLCIRGIERTDQWQPSRKTKADRKTEPQYDFGEYAYRLWKIAYERGKREALEQTEPQTERSK